MSLVQRLRGRLHALADRLAQQGRARAGAAAGRSDTAGCAPPPSSVKPLTQPPRAVIDALAGYDTSTEDSSASGPERWDAIDLEGGHQGPCSGRPAVLRRLSVPERWAAAGAARAGAAYHLCRRELEAALAALPHLATLAGRKVAPRDAADKAGSASTPDWRPRKLGKCGVIWGLIGIALLGLLLGLAIGLGLGVARRHAAGPAPWEAWVPTGDEQLDALMRLRLSVDSTGVLADAWDPAHGANAGFCSWAFVTCDASRRVTGVNLTINMDSMTLTGILPSGAVLAGLRSLRSLDMREHHISGTLPEDWASLSLEVIKLDQNQLSGPLPASFGDGPLASSLRVLTLWDGQLSGPLPPSWGRMQALETLDLSYNRLTGPLPAEWAGMTALRECWLDVNGLQGQLPTSWGQLAALERLFLSENALEGPLPAEWAGMTALTELWAEFNRLTGPLPDALGAAWAHLTLLVLNGNSLSGVVPGSWGAWNLTAAYLYNNSALTGCLPSPWQARFDENFDVAFFLLQDTALTGFCAATSSPSADLDLDLSPSPPVDASQATPWEREQQASPPALPSKGPHPSPPVRPPQPVGGPDDRQLASLLRIKASLDTAGVLDDLWPAGVSYCSWRFVSCDKTQRVVQALNFTTGDWEIEMQGKLPPGAAFAGLPGLRELDLREHLITGGLPDDWAAPGNLPSIQLIRLDNLQLRGTLPAAWSALRHLSVLTLSNNKLSGQLPASWRALVAMRLFDASFNQIGGQLPASWSAWQHVQQVWLDVNVLEGQLPASWGSLGALQKLYLAENGLSGGLPAEWAGMRNLRELSLEYNKLSGALPASWGPALARGLEKLYLNNNNLSSDVPRSWGRLRRLVAVHLFANSALRGCLPAAWQAQLRYDVDFYVRQGTGLGGFCAAR